MFGCLVRDADLTVTIIIYAEHKTTDSAAAEMKLRFSFYYIIKNFIKKQKQKKTPTQCRLHGAPAHKTVIMRGNAELKQIVINTVGS